MNRQQAINYLLSSGFSEEQINTIEQAFKQEPTNDLGVDCISRADAIRVASGYCHPSNVAKELAKLPSVTPIRPKGHWIKYCIPRCGEQHYKCTNCDEYFNFGLYSDYYKKAFKFCPNCGARMVEPQESEK